MVLSQDDEDKILVFVKGQPRTIQDIAIFIGKSWLTADSYVKKIKDKTGLINVKKFRGGTRGALKIVYWNYSESIENDDIRKNLFENIKFGKVKTDFDPFDVYQYAPDNKKKSFIEEYKEVLKSEKQGLIPLLRQVEKELYSFSGNISWINMVEKGKGVVDELRDLFERGVRVKVLCRVDVASLKNIDRLKKLCEEVGGGSVEVRHCRQPLRGFVFDDRMARFVDNKFVKDYKEGELRKNVRIFYDIFDEGWVDWLQKVFWELYRHSIPDKKRLEQLSKVMLS
ncbi:MAG: hypothetical protein GOU97_03605 [Nanoarchaeota archaeon]|nr:hypothetical protein [Nanoarchaeota archaeon]